MKSNVTLKDIAKEVGLTVNSVSRALKDSKEISATTKKLVKEVAERLGYVPNSVASSLRNGKTNLIAIVFDNMINPYFSIMTEKIQREVQKLGYDIMIFTTSEPMLSMNIYKYIYARKIDGIITFMQPTTDVIDICNKNGIAIVLLGRKVETNNIDTVTTDDFKGGYLACQTLIDNGCHSLGYIGGSFSVDSSNRRFNGFERCAKDHQMSLTQADILLVKLGYQDDKQRIGEFTRRHDGIFCFNDMLAYEVYSYCEENKTKIVGFDNIQCELFSVNRLTTISANKEKIVQKVVERIFLKINSNDTSCENFEYDVELQKGKSC